MSESKRYKLRDLINVKHGWAFKGQYMQEDGSSNPVVVAIGNFDYSGGFRFSSTRLKRYSSEYPREYALKPGDILLAMTCQTPGGEILGIPGEIPDDGETYLHNQRLGRVELISPDKVNLRYLYWIFLTKEFNRFLASSATGTKILHTAPSKILDFEVDVPPVGKQQKIARILDSLDMQAGIKTHINQTLEKIAQAIFNSWFVDFDPVKSKMIALEARGTDEDAERAAMQAISGKSEAELDTLRTQNPDQYTNLARTAALFPSAMVESELGDIPEGWGIEPLDSIANYQNGLALQKYRPENEDEYLPVVKIAQLRQGYADGEEKASSNIKPECIIDNGDVVFSWSASLLVDTWCGGRAALNQHLFKVTSHRFPKWFYYHFTRHHIEQFQNIAASKAVTMGHIKRGHLSQALCVVPPAEVLSKGNSLLGNILEKQVDNRLESQTLKDIRDALLPKLLSGELILPEAEQKTPELADV